MEFDQQRLSENGDNKKDDMLSAINKADPLRNS